MGGDGRGLSLQILCLRLCGTADGASRGFWVPLERGEAIRIAPPALALCPPRLGEAGGQTRQLPNPKAAWRAIPEAGCVDQKQWPEKQLTCVPDLFLTHQLTLASDLIFLNLSANKVVMLILSGQTPSQVGVESKCDVCESHPRKWEV